MDEVRGPLSAPVKNTGRARVLMPSSQSYEIAPQSRAVNGYNTMLARPISAKGDDFIRKMKAKKAKATRSG